MKRYEVKKETTNKNYGIYDTLMGDFCYRNLGAIGENRYCYDLGISSYEGKAYELERTMGDYQLGINIIDNKIVKISYIDREDNEDINFFQYQTVIAILEECQRYIKNNRDLKIELPGILFNSNMDINIDTKEDNFVIAINSALINLEEEKNKLYITNDSQEENTKVFKLLPFIKRNK